MSTDTVARADAPRKRRQIEVPMDEMVRVYGDRHFAPLATFYRDELRRIRGIWDRCQGDVLAGLVRHFDAGRVELITCSATHCYLPGMLPAREGIRPQLELGVQAFEMLVGRPIKRGWPAELKNEHIPEPVRPILKRLLADHGAEVFPSMALASAALRDAMLRLTATPAAPVPAPVEAEPIITTDTTVRPGVWMALAVVVVLALVWFLFPR